MNSSVQNNIGKYGNEEVMSNRIKKKDLQKLRRICRTLDITLNETEAPRDLLGEFQYSDGELHLHYGTTLSPTLHPNYLDTLCHELAHYQLAHPDRRFKQDFGTTSRREEVAASLLGLAWYLKFRTYSTAKKIIQAHGWKSSNSPWNLDARFAAFKIQMWLCAEGFLDSRGKPTLKLRDVGDRTTNSVPYIIW